MYQMPEIKTKTPTGLRVLKTVALVTVIAGLIVAGFYLFYKDDLGNIEGLIKQEYLE